MYPVQQVPLMVACDDGRCRKTTNERDLFEFGQEKPEETLCVPSYDAHALEIYRATSREGVGRQSHGLCSLYC